METVAVLAYMKFLMVSADSGSLLMVFPQLGPSLRSG
jgi:hypothetical protein